MNINNHNWRQNSCRNMTRGIARKAIRGTEKQTEMTIIGNN